jgi:hypothetical protein
MKNEEVVAINSELSDLPVEMTFEKPTFVCVNVSNRMWAAVDSREQTNDDENRYSGNENVERRRCSLRNCRRSHLAPRIRRE